MKVDAIIHQEVHLSDHTINKIVKEKLISMYGVVLNRGVRPDSLYVNDKNELIKYEDFGRYADRTVVRQATVLDIALNTILLELK